MNKNCYCVFWCLLRDNTYRRLINLLNYHQRVWLVINTELEYQHPLQSKYYGSIFNILSIFQSLIIIPWTTLFTYNIMLQVFFSELLFTMSCLKYHFLKIFLKSSTISTIISTREIIIARVKAEDTFFNFLIYALTRSSNLQYTLDS